MSKKWVLHTKKADFKMLGERFGIDPVIARVIRNRDVQTIEEMEQYLNGSKEQFFSPWLLKDMEKAVTIIIEKIEAESKIRIIGDYDIDGVCATTILYEGLRRLGANVDWKIPERMKDGYGLNERLITDAHEAGVDTILTCDNGIAATPQIAYAKELGMAVVVTDHHDVTYEEVDGQRQYIIPVADAVVNPKQEDCTYPFKNLCGAAVAWKFILALYEKIGRLEEAEEFLVFAAIATVGDVMDLQSENRILVKEGLKALSRTEQKGLRALMQVNGLDGEEITAYHIGFVLGPCLNASGRLDTAERAVRLMLASTKEEADIAAWELKEYNESRKEMTIQWTQKAYELVDTSDLKDDNVLVVYLPECHESLAGIIAGRIREKYYKPVLVFTRSEDGVKASGRSIESYNMFEELSKCRELFTKFGGHPMAAGLSMAEESDISVLRRLLNDNAKLSEEDLREKLYIDVAMPLEYISEEIIEQLSLVEPFGKGNPKPVFAELHLKIKSIFRMGREGNMLKIKVSNGITAMDALLFREADEFITFLEKEYGKDDVEKAFHGIENNIDVALAYYPAINEYKGMRSLQIIVQDYCRINKS